MKNATCKDEVFRDENGALSAVSYIDVVVIGAGASGLMCAQQIAAQGLEVLLLEGSNKPGKKILMSGGGRCNFTNLRVEPEHFISANPHFCKSALAQYTQWDFIHWVQTAGIEYEERKHGQLFCIHSAKDILKLLLDACAEHGVVLKTHCQVETVESVVNADQALEHLSDSSRAMQSRYRLRYCDVNAHSCDVNAHSSTVYCQSLVVATGGLSIPTMGASDWGYRLARQFGLKVLPTRASLVPFIFSDQFKAVFARLAGVSLDVQLHCIAASFSEALLFTHRGLSGPAVLQLSNYWQPGEAIRVDLLPHMNMEQWLRDVKKQQPRAQLRTVLSQILPRALVSELESLWWPEEKQQPLAEWKDKRLAALAHQLHHWMLTPSGTEGYRTAEVTQGGVDTDMLHSRSMECKQHPGLYFIGEVVDVTGHLGGYNFQWAWSSAYVAARAITEENISKAAI